nr:transcription or splicing factor-like protein [Theileria orientalis]
MSTETKPERRRHTRWGRIDNGKSLIIHNSTKSFLGELKMLASRAYNYSDDDLGSRWGTEEDKPFLPPPYVDLPPGLTPSQIDQFLREQRHDELARKITSGELEYVDPEIRPPSPPPVYDKNGSRVNTRDVRVKNSMNEEYNRLVEYLLKNLPGFVASADYKPLKKVRKIIIPMDKYPDYNFMGLVIGPRGCNHKRLEAESGAQISLRGRGTVKDGKNRDHQTEEDAAMPMHVHISADKEECVQRAVELIEPLLDPFHPKHEEFKRIGLEQLALVNGVALGVVDIGRCSICGGSGHRAHECQDMPIQNIPRVEVKCALCGDMGHITSDCKLAKGINVSHLVAQQYQDPSRPVKEVKAVQPAPTDPESVQKLQHYQMAYYQQQYQTLQYQQYYNQMQQYYYQQQQAQAQAQAQSQAQAQLQAQTQYQYQYQAPQYVQPQEPADDPVQPPPPDDDGVMPPS